MAAKVEAEIVRSYIENGILRVTVTWKEKGSDKLIRDKEYQLPAADASAALELQKIIRSKCNTYEAKVVALDDFPHLTKFRKGEKSDIETVLEGDVVVEKEPII